MGPPGLVAKRPAPAPPGRPRPSRPTRPARCARSRSRACRGRAAVRAGVAQLLALDFDRVIVAHGRMLPTGGRAALREAFARLDR